jgi:low affinity Fe/Cu permease
MFARRAAEGVGSPWALALVVVLGALWIVSWVHFGFSAVWLSVFSVSTSTVSLIMVVLIQATQHRDTRAIQLKLNELLRAIETARIELVHLEHRSDEEMGALHQEFLEFVREQEAAGVDGGSRTREQGPPAREEELAADIHVPEYSRTFCPPRAHPPR